MGSRGMVHFSPAPKSGGIRGVPTLPLVAKRAGGGKEGSQLLVNWLARHKGKKPPGVLVPVCQGVGLVEKTKTKKKTDPPSWGRWVAEIGLHLKKKKKRIYWGSGRTKLEGQKETPNSKSEMTIYTNDQSPPQEKDGEVV